MIIALQILFWLSIGIIFHSYVLYPFILRILSKNKKRVFAQNNDYPFVSVVISLFNEESVISRKLDTILNSNYPSEKIEILIGSDNSTDNTDKIVTEYAQIHSNINFVRFDSRQGKSNVVNKLVDKAKGDILILSDANVMFDTQTISEIVKPFSDPKIGLVDSRMTNTGLKKEGISIQEKSYITREVKIKYFEGLLWGTMMGPFGGCFAIRKNLYSPVPVNFLVDDFYLCMKVLENNHLAINNLDSIVCEDVSNNLSDEFRRKVRIATGNFQNLKTFRKLLISSKPGLAFSFWSHKVLRWISPIFIILAFACNAVLAFYLQFYLWIFLAFSLILVIPFIDFLLKKIKCHNTFLRFITHFLTMNLALFIGMFKSLKGVKSNVWKPTKRNQ